MAYVPSTQVLAPDDAAIDAANIRVETVGGTVALRDKIKPWAKRQEAEQTAWSAIGVSIFIIGIAA